ncbi:hypothetical protein E4U42_001980 [Claviceps africana]|uniref:WLM domain-containing protein n=1 Tax=Claviceps africana TaxID=83212 RepID=A0A8K0J8Z0_9HYPO|nr:hypothetical protein E4U42_001980 [Claviceps africana]
MPIGIQRLNARKSQPNGHIVFIKPLPGPRERISQEFLERIAAQCFPVMRKNHISVMTLEEYEPNREFVGRNFNAGEVVQLVLRSARSGRWLPFEYVQMVMMHELAHCKQMNHSRAFWAVRNEYAAQMEDLWRRGYTGEGIWGRGANLATGEWERDTVRSGEDMPSEHLCGGTYRSRRRKRKVTAALSYQERKQRRIRAKFGEKGVALGADEETKVKLEKGKKIVARPRVAGSARGRDLRAAAALARFEQQQKGGIKAEHDSTAGKDGEEEEKEEEGDDDDDDDFLKGDLGSDSGSDVDDGSSLNAADSHAAIDVDGTRMLDRQGRGLVKVCEDDAADAHDADARTELSQLRDVLSRRAKPGTAARGVTARIPTVRIKNEPASDDDNGHSPSRPPHTEDAPRTKGPRSPRAESPFMNKDASGRSTASTCSMCSFENDTAAATCGACAHVLDAALTPNTWRCADSGCRGTGYVNSGDCGVCGLCGQRRGEA